MKAAAAAEPFGGVLSRRALGDLDVDRDRVAREVAAGRWRTHGMQTVAVHNGSLSRTARWWRAIWETGHEIAALDGVSALQAAGLEHFTDDRVHVSVVHRARISGGRGVIVHKIIRRVPGELAGEGLSRTRPEVAAIRGAHWAVSDRQAALILVMTLQQRLTTADRLLAARRSVRGRTRRAFVTRVIRDLADGAQALGELDFLAMCRTRGIPEPSRQVVRQLPSGRVYLDAYWEDCGLAVEIDGSGHRAGLEATSDYLRDNELTLGGDTTIRINLIGLRLESDRFMDQVDRARSMLLARAAAA